jgi:transcriptional regulator with XRE-family HTH domain
MTTTELEAVLGRNLRQLRIAQGMSQVELAELANVSLGALRHLEIGSTATTSTLVKVLRALGREEWLQTLAPPPSPFNPLDLLETRRREARQPQGPPRVRRAGRRPR